MLYSCLAFLVISLSFGMYTQFLNRPEVKFHISNNEPGTITAGSWSIVAFTGLFRYMRSPKKLFCQESAVRSF